MSVVERPGRVRVSRAEALARRLESEIVEGALPPGHRLGRKSDLKHRFGVAVATVNEAIRMLEVRGLIEARPGPGGGVFVAGPSARVRLSHLTLGFKWGSATFSDCVAVRNALEPLVCREAARYRTAGDMRALRELVAKMEEEIDDPRAYLEWNWALHRRIARICRNAPLHSLYLTLLDFLEAGLDGVQRDGVDDRRNLELHRRLVDAIEDGEGAGLEGTIEEHAPTTEAAAS